MIPRSYLRVLEELRRGQAPPLKPTGVSWRESYAMKNRNRKRWYNVIGLAVVLATGRCSLQPDGSAGSTGTNGGVGKLRVLITDKPFPFSLVEEAWVKITKVEVRRGADEAMACEVEGDCADDVFCNGTETCVDGACVEGSNPCDEPLVCDEELQDCVSPGTQDGDPTPCEGEEDCADGVFCNGSETCVDGACVEGSNPCDEALVCDEELQSCVTPGTQDDDADEGDGSPFVVIFEGEKDFNLLDLQNGRTDLLAEMDVPAGTYTQMRLFVTEGTIKLFDVEEPFVLKVPSGAQTGIKLRLTFTVEDGEVTTLLVDVNLSKAFVPIPGGRIEDPTTIRNFKFQPSLAVRVVNLEEVGSISGSVVDEEGAPIGSVSVTAFNSDGDDVTSTSTEDDGTFTLGGLPPDTYSLEFSANDFNDADLADVEVVANETTMLDSVVMTVP